MPFRLNIDDYSPKFNTRTSRAIPDWDVLTVKERAPRIELAASVRYIPSRHRWGPFATARAVCPEPQCQRLHFDLYSQIEGQCPIQNAIESKCMYLRVRSTAGQSSIANSCSPAVDMSRQHVIDAPYPRVCRGWACLAAQMIAAIVKVNDKLIANSN